MRNGRTTDYQREGWRQRDARSADARIVRVVDFERCLSRLPQAAQVMLVLAHRDGHSHHQLALMSGTSPRFIQYQLSAARESLAAALDEADML